MPNDGPNGTATNGKPIVLDDFLCAIYEQRRQHRLPKITFRSAQLSKIARHDQNIGNLIRRIIQCRGEGILVRPHPLLDELSITLEGPAVLSEFGEFFRLPADHVQKSLQGILDLAILTVAELPDKTGVGGSTAKLNSLAKRLQTLVDHGQSALADNETRDRILFHSKDRGDVASLLNLPAQIQGFATTLTEVVSETKVSRSRFDSPNPQVNFALYIAGWVRGAVGQPHYKTLQELFQAAFAVIGKRTPKWIDRLPFEMHEKGRRRKAFIQSIFVPYRPASRS